MAENITGTGPRPIVRRFNQLIDALENVGARYSICGATAMGAYGAQRFTHHIDLLVAQGDLEPVVAELAKTMRELGREPTTGDAKQVRLRSKRARTLAGVDIDLMVPVDPIEAWAISTCVRARAFERKVDVVSAEALVLMKLQAYLSNPESERGSQHRADALALLRVAKINLGDIRQFLKGSLQKLEAFEKLLRVPSSTGRLG